MAKSKHNTTKRGTQKQRARTHELYLAQRYPELWRRRVEAEFQAAMAASRRERGEA